MRGRFLNACAVSVFLLVVAGGCQSRRPCPDEPGSGRGTAAVSTARDPALVRAIITVESRGDSDAVGPGQAVGILQIRPIMVEDVNRILGARRYSLADRKDPRASVEMFWIYADHYSPGASRQTIARRWNGGPTGDRKSYTLAYWEQVSRHLD